MAVDGIQVLDGGGIEVFSILRHWMRIGLFLQTAHQLLETPIAYHPSKELEGTAKGD